MRAGLLVLPTLMLLTGCGAMKDMSIDPWTTVMNQLVTKPIITANKNKGD
jgi:uncharacterized protein YcfL